MVYGTLTLETTRELGLIVSSNLCFDVDVTFVTSALACLDMTTDLTNWLITAYANEQANPSSWIFMTTAIQWAKVTQSNTVDVTNPACICPSAIMTICVSILKWLLARWLHVRWPGQLSWWHVFGRFLARRSHFASSAPVVTDSPWYKGMAHNIKLSKNNMTSFGWEGSWRAHRDTL